MTQALSFRLRVGALLLFLAVGPLHLVAAPNGDPGGRQGAGTLSQGSSVAIFAQEATPRNVILLIGDGFGPAAFTLGRGLSEALGRPYRMDEIVTGVSRTRSANSRVTDSAAGATALASGIRTNNGAIGVDQAAKPVGTVVEAAKAIGKAVGVVATSSITHATPAAFTAHVPNRAQESEIATQQVVKGIDVLFGGGRDFFLPEGQGLRRDGRDLAQEARDLGYQLVTAGAELETLELAPALGLFAAGHLAYEIDRDETDEPSLADMTRKAITLLSSRTEGFFLMVEGSRIDHAAHNHDPIGTAYEALAFDDAVGVALDFAREDGTTLVVFTADHETGGLGLGRDGAYVFLPEMLTRAQATVPTAVASIRGGADLWETLENSLGLKNLSEDERLRLRVALAGSDPDVFMGAVAGIVSKRVGVDWTTGGHTGVDVPLGAYGPGAGRLTGSLDNAEIGRRLADLLGVDIQASTQLLRATN